jgi:hypothetical protein
MVNAIELHGRLCRADGRPANPGTYDLQFRLHGAPTGDAMLWTEDVRAVAVAPGGYYHVVLGLDEPLKPGSFDGRPRFLSVRVLREGRAGEELGDRIPLLGVLLTLGDGVRRLEARIAALEDSKGGSKERRLLRRTRVLRKRVERLESGEGPLPAVVARLAALEARVARLDGEEGRVARLEDEVEDIVGPDGDLVDLSERLSALEDPTHPRRREVIG